MKQKQLTENILRCMWFLKNLPCNPCNIATAAPFSVGFIPFLVNDIFVSFLKLTKAYYDTIV